MTRTERRPPTSSAVRAVPSVVLAMLFRSVGVVAVLAVPVLTGLGSVDGAAPGARPDRQESAIWKDRYSERYPGCVPSVLWPADEAPTALLTMGQDGRLHKVLFDERHRMPTNGVPIGACR